MGNQNDKRITGKLISILRIGYFYCNASTLTALITTGIYLVAYTRQLGFSKDDCFWAISISSIIAIMTTIVCIRGGYIDEKLDWDIFRKVDSGLPFVLTFSLSRVSVFAGYILFIYSIDYDWKLLAILIVAIIEGCSYRIWVAFGIRVRKSTIE